MTHLSSSSQGGIVDAGEQFYTVQLYIDLTAAGGGASQDAYYKLNLDVVERVQL